MVKLWKITAHAAVVVLLTLTTQIGGAIWLLNLGLTSLLPASYFPKWRLIGCFMGLYILFTICIIPVLSPLTGRVALPIWGNALRAKSPIYCFFNRHYVKPEIRCFLLKNAAIFETTHPGSKLYYLDAGFPFFKGFPLFPHLSHNDGKKVDLCFFYKLRNGESSNLKPSRSGYGVFESPKKGEENTTDFCLSRGYFQYDYPKFLSLGERDDLIFDELRTRELVSLLVRDKTVKKLFIEPHLKTRLGLIKESKIRFQGCKAVRHDDHIHVEFSN